ncbi:MAG: ABC transporter permease [Acidimicrobiia bacterium]|nr:ABC transporter permease [Acidimicrobiia bacterium]NNC75621.1 ABC transporter permease [Acidimicrobiia bacterium]
MKVLTIATNSVVRLFRERTNIFFVFILPLLLVMIIGLVFGGGFTPRIGLVVEDDGALSQQLVAAIEAIDGVDVSAADSEQQVRDDIRRNELEAGVVIPAGFDADLRAGSPAAVQFLAALGTGGFEIQSLVNTEVTRLDSIVRAGQFACDQGACDEATGLAAATTAVETLDGVAVERIGEVSSSSIGQFDLGAAQNLVLFMFVTALSGSAALIQSRRLGVSRRMLSTPTSATTVVAGETLGRFFVTMVQGVFIIGVAAVAFGVDWGDPLAASVLVIAFGLVGTGAGMLMGSLFSNDEQAGGIGTFLGLGLGALGGCMVPLEVFSDSMTTVAHVTPHAWALDGFSDLIRHDGGLTDVLPEVGVLLAGGVALIVVAGFTFRRVMTR